MPALAREMLIELDLHRVHIHHQREEEADDGADNVAEVIADEGGSEEQERHQEVEAQGTFGFGCRFIVFHSDTKIKQSTNGHKSDHRR